jgi:hypothetical protein
MAADVLLAKALLPPYTALMLCFPLASADVLKVAVPVLSRVPVPTVVLPCWTLTVPVGTPIDEVTVAVNVTSWPTPDGFGEEPSTVRVEALFTVCVSLPDVLPAN